MKIDEFTENVITQKNVVTHLEDVQGGMHNGTQTSYTEETTTVGGLNGILIDLLGVDNTHTDHFGDWDDEGTCGDE